MQQARLEVSSFAREKSRVPRGRLLAAGPGGPARTAPSETPRRPAARPPPSRSGRPPAGPTPPPTPHPPLPTLGWLGPRSPPPCLPKRWRERRAGRAGGASGGGPRWPARRAPRARTLPARTARAAGPRPLTFGAADLPTPSGGGKRKLSRRLPSGPPRLPDLRGAAAEPGGRQRSRSRPSVRPVARSSSSVHYIIFSFSEGWAGAAGSGRKETFASFLHPPPPPKSALKKQG